MKIGLENLQYRCHSWRNDFTALQTIDVFNDSRLDGVIEMVQVWQNKRCKVLIGIASKFCEADRRLLWASYGTVEDNEGGANLEWIRDKYHDSEKMRQTRFY